MNCQRLFQDFNSSKFVVFTSLLAFFNLFALRLDETIRISWWLVFIPLWAWKALVVLGAFVGVLVWIFNPEYRLSESSYTHFKSMLISVSLQLLLLMFELLVADKLESGRHFWTLAFIPLIFISLLSIAVSVWALKNERDFELELLCSVNVLQFIFIALRLDRFITWNWVVVFVPIWILLCLALIGVLYAIIFAVIIYRSPEVSFEQRRASFFSALTYMLIVFPLLIFFILLSSKLDSNSYYAIFANDGHETISHGSGPPFTIYYTPSSLSSSSSSSLSPSLAGPSVLLPPALSSNSSPYHFDMDYFYVFVPLYFTLSILICMSFCSKGGNLWWFGLRKDFCSFLFIICPCLREYANISYNFDLRALTTSSNQQQHRRSSNHNERTTLTSGVQNVVTIGSATDGSERQVTSKKYDLRLKKVVITQQPNQVLTPNVRLDTPD